MKKSKKTSPPATIQDVKEIVSHVISTVEEMFKELKSDISELKNDVSELKGDVSELKGDVSGLKDFRTEQREANEQIVGELKAIREEQAAQAMHNRRVSDSLFNHGSRITKLESASLPRFK